MTPSTVTNTSAQMLDRTSVLQIEPVSTADLATDIALAANAALDGGKAGETDAQRAARYERALRDIGVAADQTAQLHGELPVRWGAEWEEPTDAPT